ncbi:MAG: bifunctional DNA-formamidopyrimidine glycosylase/DNA-(apurinic or apyrimidinic site) lyase [Planctomycetota bacterium]|nr:bifunctional DNA-formamidopyrimidine glycosylase/DNA-(apurinic or apyrimidinic site) lyase [Planctomycetota bacterium]
MPELPEVETVARLIRPQLVGRRVESVRVAWARSLGGVSPTRFRRQVSGSTFRDVWRRGKYIVMELEPQAVLVGHLRMSGRMRVRPRNEHPGDYARVSLELDDGGVFDFIDVRKFGRLVLAERAEQVFPELGPEPLGPEFTREWFRSALRSRKRRLKPLLLDQSFVAGLGNIYTDEVLHAARLHPLRQAHKIAARAADALHEAIRDVLQAAIDRQGSSFDSFYRTPEGQPGSYQHEFRVYGRTGKPCYRCGRAVKRIVVGQRGTHLCTACQRAPRG